MTWWSSGDGDLYPQRVVKGNVLVHEDGESAAIYRVATRSFEYQPERERSMRFEEWVTLANRLRMPWAIHRATRSYSIEAYMRDVEAMGEGEEWREWCSWHADRLADLDAMTPGVETFVSVVLDRPEASRIEELLARARRLDRKTQHALDSAERDARRAMVQSGLRFMPASERDIVWLLARTAGRHVWEPTLPALDESRYGVDPVEDATFAAAQAARLVVDWNAERVEVDRDDGFGRRLIVTDEGRETYQALLATRELPSGTFPTDHVCAMFDAVSLDFPVDFVARIDPVPNVEALKMTKKKKRDTRAEVRQQEEMSDVGVTEEAEADLDDAAYVSRYVRSSERPPLLQVTLTAAIGAADRDVLDDRVEMFRQRFGPQIVWREPTGIQKILYADSKPRADRGIRRRRRMTDYQFFATPLEIAGMLPNAGQGWGDEKGCYLGWASDKGGGFAPALIDMTRPVRENRAPVYAMIGGLGGGKTVLYTRLMDMALRMGWPVSDSDPKPDHRVWERDAYSRERSVVVDLHEAPEYRGVLDPMVVVEAQARADAALAYYVAMLPQPVKPEWQTRIVQAIHVTLEGREPSSAKLIEGLLQSGDPYAQEAGLALQAESRGGLASLGLGTGGRSLLGVDTQALVIRASGLMPYLALDADQTSATTRKARMTMQLIAELQSHRAALYAKAHPNGYSLIAKDEAWYELGTPAGRARIQRATRMGRERHEVVVLSSQSLAEFKDAGSLQEFVSAWFVFRHDEREAAERALVLLGCDVTEAMVEQVMGLESGWCFARDLDGRIAKLRIDVEDSLLQASRTDIREAEPAVA